MKKNPNQKIDEQFALKILDKAGIDVTKEMVFLTDKTNTTYQVGEIRVLFHRINNYFHEFLSFCAFRRFIAHIDASRCLCIDKCFGKFCVSILGAADKGVSIDYDGATFGYIVAKNGEEQLMCIVVGYTAT